MYFEARDIDVHYDQVQALRGVTITVDKGEIVALIGANGAGKSTTLRAITGLKRPSRGEIHFEGERIDGLSPDQIVRRGIAMVPEGRRVFPFMSVKDNLLMGAFTRADKGETAARIDQALIRFPRLKERWSQDAGTMSGGEQQMLVISRALMSSPKLLLLDEPSLGIAPKLVQDIARSIVAINREEGISVILVEQNSRMALKISHRAYALSLGQVAIEGECETLRNDDRIRALYLGGEI
jgi:branched-chain amino acid transport system ATP-binding protein